MFALSSICIFLFFCIVSSLSPVSPSVQFSLFSQSFFVPCNSNSNSNSSGSDIHVHFPSPPDAAEPPWVNMRTKMGVLVLFFLPSFSELKKTINPFSHENSRPVTAALSDWPRKCSLVVLCSSFSSSSSPPPLHSPLHPLPLLTKQPSPQWTLMLEQDASCSPLTSDLPIMTSPSHRTWSTLHSMAMS